MKTDIVNNLKDAGRWVLGLVGTMALYVVGLGVGLFLCFTLIMKIGAVVNDTSMLQEARTTNIYDSIRRQSRNEDMELAKLIYNYRIESGYYEKEKN
jgi:hypothetical protein